MCTGAFPGYGTYGDRWWKIPNPNYSQYEGRRQLFEKRAAATPSH
jgi:hypothetical protein